MADLANIQQESDADEGLGGRHEVEEDPEDARKSSSASGLLTEVDHVEEDKENVAAKDTDRLRSASLTGSLHEMEDDMKKLGLKSESSEEEEDSFHDAVQASSKDTWPTTKDITLSIGQDKLEIPRIICVWQRWTALAS